MQSANLLKISQVAKKLSVSKKTILNWIKEKKLIAVKLPKGGWRISPLEVDRILQHRNI